MNVCATGSTLESKTSLEKQSFPPKPLFVLTIFTLTLLACVGVYKKQQHNHITHVYKHSTKEAWPFQAKSKKEEFSCHLDTEKKGRQIYTSMFYEFIGMSYNLHCVGIHMLGN